MAQSNKDLEKVVGPEVAKSLTEQTNNNTKKVNTPTPPPTDPPPKPPSKPPKPHQHLEIENVREDKYEAALGSLREAIKEKPDNKYIKSLLDKLQKASEGDNDEDTKESRDALRSVMQQIDHAEERDWRPPPPPGPSPNEQKADETPPPVPILEKIKEYFTNAFNFIRELVWFAKKDPVMDEFVNVKPHADVIPDKEKLNKIKNNLNDLLKQKKDIKTLSKFTEDNNETDYNTLLENYNDYLIAELNPTKLQEQNVQQNVVEEPQNKEQQDVVESPASTPDTPRNSTKVQKKQRG